MVKRIQDLLAQAERYASIGDLSGAEELLRDAAELQEKELGPFHPDLADTVNNLAIIAEKTGRPREAETFYRRAVEIASASLSPGDPKLAETRQNLEDFCHANGLPIERPAVAEPARSVAMPRPTATPAPLPPAVVGKTFRARRPTMAIGLVAFAIAAVLIARPRSTRLESTTAPAVPAPAAAAETAPTAPAALAPNERTPSPAPTVAKGPAPAGIALGIAQLCRSFSTSNFGCVAAGDSVTPGAVVLYTRVRSRHGGVIVHRWYQGNELRKSTQLRVGANAADGYRTYSRQVVDAGDWRVEVRSASGDLLHEERFAVRQ